MSFLFGNQGKELSEYGIGTIKEGLKFKHDNKNFKITGNISKYQDYRGLEVSFDAENDKTKELFSFTINHLNHITMKEKKMRRGGSRSNEKTLEYNQETLVNAINSFINKSDEGNSFNVGETRVTPSSVLPTLQNSTTLGKVTGEELGSYEFQPLKKKIGPIQSALGPKVCDGIVEKYDGKWSPEDETKCKSYGFEDCKQSTIINEQNEADDYFQERFSEERLSQGTDTTDRYSNFTRGAPGNPRLQKLKRYSSVSRGGKIMCSKKGTKKYKTRNSPPYPANSCKNMKKKGNDGKFYVSVAKGGTYRWMPFAKKTKSKR